MNPIIFNLYITQWYSLCLIWVHTTLHTSFPSLCWPPRYPNHGFSLPVCPHRASQWDYVVIWRICCYSCRWPLQADWGMWFVRTHLWHSYLTQGMFVAKSTFSLAILSKMPNQNVSRLVEHLMGYFSVLVSFPALPMFLPQLCLLSCLRREHHSVTVLFSGWLLNLPSLGNL